MPESVFVSVEYFALFRALARKDSEIIEAESGRAGEIFDRLGALYAFPLSRESVHLAVNDEYAPWDRLLQTGDRVVFLPPVSGG